MTPVLGLAMGKATRKRLPFQCRIVVDTEALRTLKYLAAATTSVTYALICIHPF